MNNMGAVTMYMNSRLMILLVASCAMAFGAAFWAFTAGAGLLVAFLVYSFGGSMMLMALSLVSYMTMDDDADEDVSRLDIFRAKMDAGMREAEGVKSTLAAA